MTLSDLYKELKGPERSALAARAGTSRTYLYQIAKRVNGRRPSVEFIRRLVAADKRLKFKDLFAEYYE